MKVSFNRKSQRLSFIGCVLLLLMTTHVLAQVIDKPPVDLANEQARIAFLIDSIASLEGAVFIRNGTEHSATEAAQHLANKLARAQSSFFAPAKADWTAELFIEKLATKSSISGKPYIIRFNDQSEQLAGEWLTKQLQSMNQQTDTSNSYSRLLDKGD